VKWDQHNPIGTGNGRRPHDGWMAQFLRAEAARQAEMIQRVRQRVERDLERTEEIGTVPGEDTMRAAKFAQEGFKILATLELEAAKVELLARRVLGKAPMTDEEYAAQLEALGRDGLDALPVEEIEAALQRRRALAAGGG
jgi:hypothetical protein